MDGASASMLEFLVKDFARAATRELALTWLNALFVAHCMPTLTGSSAAADSPLRIAAPDSPVSGTDSGHSRAAANSASEGRLDAVGDQPPALSSPTAEELTAEGTSAAATGADSSSVSPSTDLALVTAGGSSELRSDPEMSQPNAYQQVLMGLLEGLRYGTLSNLSQCCSHA